MTEAVVTNATRDELIALVPELRAFALSLSRNPSTADDLVQETVLKAWAKLDSFSRARTCAPGCSRSCATRSIRMRARASARSPMWTAPMPRGCRRNPTMTGGWRCVTLPWPSPRCPTISARSLILIGASGLSYEEAARTCGCAVGTIKSRLNRGRARLAELLEPAQDTAGSGVAAPADPQAGADPCGGRASGAVRRG